MAKSKDVVSLSMHVLSDGRARARVGRTTYSLGKADEEGSHLARFDELRARLTVGTGVNLANRYLEAVRREYVTHDPAQGAKLTKHGLRIQSVLRLFVRTPAAQRCPREYGPSDLKAFREWLAVIPSKAWARGTINEYARVVVGMFRWAAEEELVEEPTWRALTAVRPLRRGRACGGASLREGRQVTPPAAELLEACLGKCRPMLARMLRLQMVTGMRAGELVQMRPCDIYPTPTPGVMVYRVPDHKGTWRDKDRLVFLGPRAMAELEGLAGMDPEAYIWSPKRAMAEHLARRRASRTIPMYASHMPERRALKRGKRHGAGDCYTTDSYRRAIWRACEMAWPHPTIKGPASKRTPEERRELADWHAAHHVNPHQLRHAASTSIAERVSLEMARMLLGHADVATTMRYTHVTEDRAAQAAAQVG